MKRIALLSDTHSYLDDRLVELLSECDEIWHAGDTDFIWFEHLFALLLAVT